VLAEELDEARDVKLVAEALAYNIVIVDKPQGLSVNR
jgi:hypothetical protein